MVIRDGEGVEGEMFECVREVVSGVLRRYRAGEVSEVEASVVLWRCAQFLKVMGGGVSGSGIGLGSVRSEVGDICGEGA